MRRGWAVAVFTLATATAVGTAQTGETIPAGFRSYIVVDDRYPPKAAADPKAKPTPDPRSRAGKIHDFVVERGLDPTLAIFTRAKPAADIPAARLAQQLQPLLAEKYKGTNFGAFVVFLTLDAPYPDDEQRDVKAQAVRDLAAQLNTPKVPFGLAPGKSPETDAWKIGPDDETVVVLYNQMRVVGRWPAAGGKVDDAAIKQILAAVDKVVTGK